MRPMSLLFALMLSSSALAVPMELSHSGRLLDTAGVPVDGSHSVEVGLYSDTTTTSALWSASISASFDNGYFAIDLGSDPLNPLDDSVFDTDLLWIGLGLDGGGEIGDRLPLRSVPFARRAGTATNLSGGTVDASEISIGGTTVIDSSGAIVGPGTGTLGSLGPCSADDVASYDGSSWACAAPAVGWARVSDIPAGFVDGLDDDTLATLSCGNGQALAWDASASSWGCSVPYADADAVAAMGAAGPNNTFNHTRYTNAEAVTAVQAGDLALSGNLGLGLAPNPDLALDAVGAIRPGMSTACDASLEGALRYNTANSRVQICNGVGWSTLALARDGASPAQASGSCLQILQDGLDQGDGRYWLNTGTGPFEVWCDMTTDGGGWTLITAITQLGAMTPVTNSTPVLPTSANLTNRGMMLANVTEMLLVSDGQDVGFETSFDKAEKVRGVSGLPLSWQQMLDALNKDSGASWGDLSYITGSDDGWQFNATRVNTTGCLQTPLRGAYGDGNYGGFNGVSHGAEGSLYWHWGAETWMAGIYEDGAYFVCDQSTYTFTNYARLVYLR